MVAPRTSRAHGTGAASFGTRAASPRCIFPRFPVATPASPDLRTEHTPGFGDKAIRVIGGRRATQRDEALYPQARRTDG